MHVADGNAEDERAFEQGAGDRAGLVEFQPDARAVPVLRAGGVQVADGDPRGLRGVRGVQQVRIRAMEVDSEAPNSGNSVSHS
ncbi:hypothetical protein GCM10008959_31610 [Deinococcus seoulensis]|uniref:Uncharacterized protein n=1 Tax=Deinococcus seoulensis TaxID=1837379 RepID=A0ABQ2RUG4_9DEIO|nr:hypothetical protein GCM10008959_31610 [Deinococcus seoulensis]